MLIVRHFPRLLREVEILKWRFSLHPSQEGAVKRRTESQCHILNLLKILSFHRENVIKTVCMLTVLAVHRRISIYVRIKRGYYTLFDWEIHPCSYNVGRLSGV